MSLPHQVATFLMGFRPVPNSVFVAEHYDANRKEREDVMREALKGYNLVIADQKITNLNLLRKVLQEIGQAEYGIAEITELNENVILELGIMYGLNKPALILAKNTQSSDFVPSNLQGQEQLRYADNEELSRKLRDGMANVSELLRKQPSDADVQWLAGLLEMAAEHFEVLALAMKLEEKHLTARIVKFRSYGQQVVAVLNIGQESGLRDGLQLQIFSIEKGTGVEEPVGILRIFHTQPHVSLGAFHATAPDHTFWRNTFASENELGNLVPPIDHILRPHREKQYPALSIDQVERRVEYYRQALALLRV